MNPEPKIDPTVTDEEYEVEIVDADPRPAPNDDDETGNIRKEGDPVGDNFA